MSCPPRYEVPYKGRVAPLVSTFYGMIANIDENVGTLMDQLKQMGIDDNTLVIFMNDNGGFDLSCKIWNAGMKGSKNTAHNGGTRAMSFWRWPVALKPATCDALTAHIDMFPTFAELAGAKVPTAVVEKLEGFSLVPLLKDPAQPGTTIEFSIRTSVAGQTERRRTSTASAACATGRTCSTANRRRRAGNCMT